MKVIANKTIGMYTSCSDLETPEHAIMKMVELTAGYPERKRWKRYDKYLVRTMED